jgi:hypothetical protein
VIPSSDEPESGRLGSTQGSTLDRTAPGPGWAARVGASSWVVGVVGLLIGVGVVLRLLVPNGMDATMFLAFGKDSPELTKYAHGLLGQVDSRPLGHDGKFFFAQANDPWYLEPEQNASMLDRPFYRGQRMLFPMLAGGFGLFPPRVIVWSMLATNLLALAIGATLAARIAMHFGRSPWLGLAVPLNLGLLYEIWIGGAGVVAYMFCLGAIYALAYERTWAASICFAAAALTRESMLAFAAGVFLLLWLDQRRYLWRLVVTPLLAMAIWDVYLRFRLAGVSGLGATWAVFAPPFDGFLRALREWTDNPSNLLACVAILAVVIPFIPLALRSRLAIAWGALPFVALAVVLSVQVWRVPSDLARALVPVFTAAPFLLAIPRRDSTERVVSHVMKE